ncbi:HlyD family efflux transporter periplasmic adaptor subunit [Ramlibacter sp. G-1-2-2]|uniref:HlyD family efflux transporter periplasmic adaptor subunit n=1 Tax=Ramlibacter agri TaxID=2728837 RepID=A0A848HAI5_9BURK|nr:HlyD family efflux transporter periplasmic adaptor subunit [Ramlibacter agri]NML48046.1 HlyD family efflux transporter periplasmic adaptor subunit [Ramlibacter agri]
MNTVTSAPFGARDGTALHAHAATDAHAWTAFANAGSDAEFCLAWLALQCTAVPGVRAGLLLLKPPGTDSYVPAAVWPDPRRDLSYLTEAAQRALGSRSGTVLGLEAADQALVAGGTLHVAFPVETEGAVHGAVVLDLAARPEAQLQAVLRQLLWGAGWLEALLRRQGAGRESRRLERAAAALDLLQAMQQHHELGEAAMALVNELGTRVQADRVCIGLLHGGQLKVQALSRTAWFDPRSQLVEAIATAMEEAIDQDSAVALPPVASARGRVSVAHRELAARASAEAVLTVPLASGGRNIGALMLERSKGPAFDTETVLLVQVLAELVAPGLERLLERERPLGGRWVEQLAVLRERLFGPRHPTLKLGAVLAVAACVFVLLAHGEFRVSARTMIEGATQRSIVAPFESFLAEAKVRAGDHVKAGQLLARLDDRDLQLERVRWTSEKEQAERKYRDALARRDRVASRILAAQVGQADAQLSLVDERLARTQLTAPFDGIVVTGDLSQLLGAPLEQGKVLFEVAPLDAYRVVLQVDERDVGFVRPQEQGTLALAGLTERTLPFSVRAVTSVSTPRDGRNFFRVEATLADAPPTLRPGMEGVGKIDAGRASLAWIWTRSFVDWARIAFWSWTP